MQSLVTQVVHSADLPQRTTLVSIAQKGHHAQRQPVSDSEPAAGQPVRPRLAPTKATDNSEAESDPPIPSP